MALGTRRSTPNITHPPTPSHAATVPQSAKSSKSTKSGATSATGESDDGEMAAILAENMEDGTSIASVSKDGDEEEKKEEKEDDKGKKGKKGGLWGGKKKKKEGEEETKEEEPPLVPHHTTFEECHVCYEISGRWREHLNMFVCDHCYAMGTKHGDMKSEQDLLNEGDFDAKRGGDFAEQEVRKVVGAANRSDGVMGPTHPANPTNPRPTHHQHTTTIHDPSYSLLPSTSERGVPQVSRARLPAQVL